MRPTQRPPKRLELRNLINNNRAAGFPSPYLLSFLGDDMNLTISSAIDFKLIGYLDEVIEDIQAKRVPKVDIYLESGGGTPQFLPILKKLVEKMESITDVTIYNSNECSSAALEFFMFFTNRRFLPNAYSIIHKTVFSFSSKGEDHIKRVLDLVNKNEEEYWEAFWFYCVMMGMTEKEHDKVRNVVECGGDYTLFEDDAEKWGITTS